MEFIMILVAVIIMVLLIQRMMPVKGVRQITTAELKKELNDSNKQFIDVRTFWRV